MAARRNLSRSHVPAQRTVLEEIAVLAPDEPADSYGAGVTAPLEERLAELFGVDACLVMPSGKAMRNAALKVWPMRWDATGSRSTRARTSRRWRGGPITRCSAYTPSPSGHPFGNPPSWI